MKIRIVALGALLGLTAAGLGAQIWTGSEAVALQVSDTKGRPIAGARVVLTFQGIEGETGPDIVGTDDRGRAVIAGLAPGPWQLEVAHPEYLSYIAMIDIRRGKKPLVGASFLEAGGRSLESVKVKVAQGDKQIPSPILEARQPAAATPPPARIAAAPETTTRSQPRPSPPTQVQAEPETQPVPAPVIEPRPEVPESQTEAVPSSVEAAPPPPARTAEPVAEPPVASLPDTAAEAPPPDVAVPPATVEPPVAAPAPQPTVEPPAPITATERTAPEAPVTPVPEPATEPQPQFEPESPTVDEPAQAAVPPPPVVETPPQPTPTPPPIAAAAKVPAPSPPALRVTSRTAGTCADCESAEWSLEVSQLVTPRAAGSAGGCDAAVLAAAEAPMNGLSTSIQLELASFIGPVADGTAQEAVRRVEPDLAASFDDELASYVGGSGPCQLVGLVLPRGVRFSRVTYTASDASANGACSPGQECAIGQARWLASARVERGPSSTIVYGLFENSSSDHGRLAGLKVYFRPPNASWRPRLPTSE